MTSVGIFGEGLPTKRTKGWDDDSDDNCGLIFLYIVYILLSLALSK